jgi:hypothetical protein
MTEVKLRLLAAERVSAAHESFSGMSSLNSEFCFLQIRKIIELVGFSGIVREERRYRHFRESEPRRQAHVANNPARDWNAKKILSRLVKLSPHMMPIPLGAVSHGVSGICHFDRAQMTVNHGRLIELYDSCSAFMHIPNPLVDNYGQQVEQLRVAYLDAPKRVKDALDFLRQMLWVHAAVQLEWENEPNPGSVDNPKSAWLVDFGDPANSHVHMKLAIAENSNPIT